MSPGALSWVGGVWFSSWYVVSIGTGHIAQSPPSGPKWSPAFKIEPPLALFTVMLPKAHLTSHSRISSCR